ncbi:MFS transporter [Actinotalea sp. M2MS4P-6]|uniref:MFS transporter n=1 Tax=Actinotalea sp. M2MS4P-6 TaxID=2983762 RepID=UPI0021E41DAB|nr:MFS transporter [Actinotalea sp. M2MS4P-6]MCV2395332.1 MFS transporter [Actinotalea sp. M2MS4P-6]
MTTDVARADQSDPTPHAASAGTPDAAHDVPAEGAPHAAAKEPLGPRFRALLTSTGLANLADGIVQVGLPLYAVTLTRSPSQVALLTAASWLPWLLLALVGGMAVDRSDRKRVQVAALGTRAVLLTGAAALVLTGHMSMLLLVTLALAYGATDVLVDLAETALVPDVAPRSRLQAANGRVQAVQMVAGAFVGAPIAGLLLGWDATALLAVPAVLAAAGAAVLATIRGSYRHATSGPRGPRAALHEIREGLSTLVHHPVLRPMTIAGAVFNMASTGYTTLLVLWAVGEGSALGLAPEQYAWIGVAMAVGAVTGSVLVEPALRVVPELRLILGGWWAGAVLLAVPVLFPVPWLLYPVLVAIGMASASANVVSRTLRQRLVAPRLMGRVTGASRTLGFGLMPLGAVLAGVAADRWGLAPVMLAAAAVCVAVPALPALTVRQRMLDEA